VQHSTLNLRGVEHRLCVARAQGRILLSTWVRDDPMTGRPGQKVHSLTIRLRLASVALAKPQTSEVHGRGLPISRSTRPSLRRSRIHVTNLRFRVPGFPFSQGRRHDQALPGEAW
jgi:hypothetical protein